jgi:hypothetical protein
MEFSFFFLSDCMTKRQFPSWNVECCDTDKGSSHVWLGGGRGEQNVLISSFLKRNLTCLFTLTNCTETLSMKNAT